MARVSSPSTDSHRTYRYSETTLIHDFMAALTLTKSAPIQSFRPTLLISRFFRFIFLVYCSALGHCHHLESTLCQSCAVKIILDCVDQWIYLLAFSFLLGHTNSSHYKRTLNCWTKESKNSRHYFMSFQNFARTF